MDTQDPLPLTETTLFILLSLTHSPNHGYAIMKEVETLSEARVKLSTGTLYGALKRLLDQGWIERVDEIESTGRDQKYYQLTETGQRILNAEISRLQALLKTATLRLKGNES